MWGACFHLFYLCSILRLAKVVITYVNLIYRPSKLWRVLWVIKFIQWEIQFLCHTVYIKLLLLLFLETKWTLEWPVALGSRNTAWWMHVGARPVPVLVHHLSTRVLQCCWYLALSQLNPTSLLAIWKVLEKEVAFKSVPQVCSDSLLSVQKAPTGETVYQKGSAKLGERVQLKFFKLKKKKSATLKWFVNWYLLWHC